MKDMGVSSIKTLMSRWQIQHGNTTREESTKDTFIFDYRLILVMADSIQTYIITAGIFAFLVAVLFGSRARRYMSGYKSGEQGGHTGSDSG